VKMNRGIAQTPQPPATAGGGQPLTLLDHPRGQYRFLLGLPAYSAGVIAANDYEIVRATFSQPVPLDAAFRAIDKHFSTQRIPTFALCALELRSPRPLSSDEFGAFNRQYAAALSSRSILLPNGRNPIARTNVAPALFPPAETAVHAFSYVVRSRAARPTFIIAGGGELPDGSINPSDIIRSGDISPGAIAEKARYVAARMTARLHAIGVSWTNATAINVYTARELGRELTVELLTSANNNTLSWNYARPPIVGVEFEMDVRGVRQEIVLG
jgi:hypothetical protein